MGSEEVLPATISASAISRHTEKESGHMRSYLLSAHTLRAETSCWQNHNRHCDKCDLRDVQDEKHFLFNALAWKCAI